MHAIGNRTNQLKFYGAVLAMAALIVGVLAVALAGGAQAQSPDNSYDDPQPCGPGAETAFQPEPHEVTTGHFALFDAYWQWFGQEPNTGVLHTNLCPPVVVETTEIDPDTELEETVTALTDSDIDIGEAIFHVLDHHLVMVTDDDPSDGDASHLHLLQYQEVGEYAEVGDRVWWLRLDDPDTQADETSDLTLGFSTMRFDDLYWGEAGDGQRPFRFKFELQRNPGIDPAEHPHLLAYRAREWGQADLIWDSARADTQDMMMEPGQLEDLQWVFTKPGTYEIWVHLQGWVRQAHNRPTDAPEDWAPISQNETETSEVKRYVIHVGSEFTEVEPPVFGVNVSVAEGSPAGAAVGGPIPIFQAEVDVLGYQLSGEGSDDFTLVPSTEPHAVQIVVGEDVQLDLDARATYDLTLDVTDNVDHENNDDDAVDDTLWVRIVLEPRNDP